MLTRRQLIKASALTGAVTIIGAGALRAAAVTTVVPGGSLDPTTVPKYVSPLFILPAMPMAAAVAVDGLDCYNVGVRQFAQQILPAGFPASQVFGYGSVDDPSTFHY